MKKCFKLQSKKEIIFSRNLWNGNIFLKPHDLSSHDVLFVDWTHAQVSPITMDVIHVLFTCCDTDVAITEALNCYYDYLKARDQLVKKQVIVT